jgi:hypothetical protein
VRNIAYEKLVAARFTLDDWTTVSEVLARYTDTGHHGDSPDSEEGGGGKWDRFAFSISLECYAARRAFTLLLAVRFTAPGVGEWWDNNGGDNFRVVLAHPQSSSSEGSKLTVVPGGPGPGASASESPSPIIPTAGEFPRRPQAVTVTRFANAQAANMACTRSLLRPYVTPAPSTPVVTN